MGAVARVVDAADERLEVTAVVYRRVGHGHRQMRTAVEATLEGDDPRPSRRLFGELHRVLHGLCPGVHEHDLIYGVRQEAGQLLAEVEHGLVAVDAGLRVGALGGLLLHRADDAGVSVTGADDSDPHDEIEPLAALDVVDPTPLGMVDRDGRDRLEEVRQVLHDRRLLRHERDLQT